MANVQHSALTDPELHEPKDISTASSGEVYVADGSASGAWGLAETIEATKSVLTNGYVKLPGGLIMQWGTGFVSGGGSAQINFPISFPTNVLNVVATAGNTGSGGGQSDYFGIAYLTSTKFNVYNGYDGGQNVYWQAIGY